jgi:hypothetical protein
MGAMGIVRSRDMISQTGIAGTGEAGHFDSKAPAELNNWWRAGADCFARHLHRSKHFRYVSQANSQVS